MGAGSCGYIGYERIERQTDEYASGAAEGASQDPLLVSTCGNGIVEADEPCDEGGASITCHANCQAFDCATGCTCAEANGRTLMFCASPLSWDAADEQCRAAGMRLIELRSEADQTWLVEEREGANVSQNWLGAYAPLGEEALRWSSGAEPFWDRTTQSPSASYESDYLPWGNGDPNNFRGNEACVLAANQMEWRDYPCVRSFPYACEGFVASPAPTITALRLTDGNLQVDWEPTPPIGNIDSFRVTLSGAIAQDFTLDARARTLEHTLPPETQGLVTVQVTTTQDGVDGMPSLLRGVPAGGDWMRAEAGESAPRQIGVNYLIAHSLNDAFDGSFPDSYFMTHDPVEGQNDDHQHYVIGLFNERYASMINREKRLAGRRVSFNVEFIDNAGLLELQAVGGTWEHPFRVTREGTNSLRQQAWEVSAHDLSRYIDYYSFRFTGLTWGDDPGERLFLRSLSVSDWP